MADEYLKDQDPFAGSSIQDTDLFWISVDNGDTTFSTYKITGLQLKSLIANLYNEDGEISVTRTVDVDDSTGQLIISTTDTKFSITGSSVLIENTNSGTRRVNAVNTHLDVLSNKIVYDNFQIYQGSGATVDSPPADLITVTPVIATNFQIQAEVKGYYAGTQKVYYARIDGLYKTISGTTTQIDLTPFVQESPSSGMSATLAISGTNIALRVTGVSSQVVDWKYIVKVF